MPKIARVLITTQCNLKCEYCCNKLPEVQESIKFTTMDEFIKNSGSYDVINISGGEPTLEADKLIKLINKIDSKPKIYLYTNGFRILPPIIDRLDGVNIGCHKGFIKEALTTALNWNIFMDNVVLHIESEFYKEFHSDNPSFFDEIKKDGIKVKTWKMNDCNKIEEDRFII